MNFYLISNLLMLLLTRNWLHHGQFGSLLSLLHRNTSINSLHFPNCLMFTFLDCGGCSLRRTCTQKHSLQRQQCSHSIQKHEMLLFYSICDVKGFFFLIAEIWSFIFITDPNGSSFHGECYNKTCVCWCEMQSSFWVMLQSFAIIQHTIFRSW